MIVEHEKIPDNSYELRVWEDGEDTLVAPIKTVLNLKNTGFGQCVVSMAHGDLDNELNILIGLQAIELGFNWLEFYVAKGEKVTRHATYLYSDANFDWYGVDLYKKRQELGLGD